MQIEKNYLNNAMLLAQKGQYTEAAIYFEKLSHVKINDARVNRAAGIVYLNIDEFDQSIKFFKRSLNQNNNQADVHNFLADLYKKTQQIALAITHFQQAIALNNSIWQFHFNLALCYEDKGSFEQASSSFKYALKLNNDNESILLAIARIESLQGEHETAIKTLKMLLAKNDNHDLAHFKLGESYENNHDFSLALASYNTAIRLNSKVVRYFECAGLCAVLVQKPEAALQIIEEGLDKFPSNRELLNIYSNLRYELKIEQPFQQYKINLAKEFSPIIQTDFINSLMLDNQLENAEQELSKFHQLDGDSLQYLTSFCSLRKKQGNSEEIIKKLNDHPHHKKHLSLALTEAYLATENYLAAKPIINNLLSIEPNDQYVIALKSLLLRATDEQAYQALCNYDELATCRELIYPSKYGNIDNFNKALKEVLAEIQFMKSNPLNQSVRGGIQSPGNIFEQPFGVLKDLKNGFIKTLIEFLTDANKSLRHPILDKFSGQLACVSAWSIFLDRAGFHNSHVHTRGWYSTAYYVDVPSVVSNENTQGYLQLGLPGIACNKAFESEVFIKPEPGYIAMFPSYFWHGTLPFESDQQRVVVAGDFIPSH